VLGGGVVVCCEPGLVLGDVATGFCELTSCNCWLGSDVSRAITISCPQQESHAGKTAKVVSNRKCDFSMTLISPSPDESVGHE
jgi:hypothetical protein